MLGSLGFEVLVAFAPKLRTCVISAKTPSQMNQLLLAVAKRAAIPTSRPLPLLLLRMLHAYLSLLLSQLLPPLPGTAHVGSHGVRAGAAFRS